MMIYKNSIIFVRTRRNTTVGVVAFAAKRYMSQNPGKFSWDGMYVGDSIELAENGRGDIIVTILDSMHDSKIEIKNKVTVENVESIEILSHHIS